jgi:hypothetical protein
VISYGKVILRGKTARLMDRGTLCCGREIWGNYKSLFLTIM